MNTETILGIDPGTRFIGIAVVRRGVLIHSQIRSFQGEWSPQKLKAIILWLNGITARYDITKVKVKIPDVFPTALGYNQLIGSLNVLCEKKDIQVRYYPFSEIKARFCAIDRHNKTELMQVIVRRYPELIVEYRKEQQNKNAHYHKIFQAVAVISMP